MILLHIIGGLVGLTSGAVALSAPKGAKLHRKSGMIFVCAMMVLSASGAVMAALIPERISVMAGASGVAADVLLAGARIVHAMATPSLTI